MYPGWVWICGGGLYNITAFVLTRRVRNLVDSVDQFPSTTAPEVVAALVDLLNAEGASQVSIGDGPAYRRDALSIARSQAWMS